jgi:hypothetical protein
MSQSSIASPTGLASGLGGQGLREMVAIAAVAIVVVGGAELLLRFFEVPQYVLPTPSAIGSVFGSAEMPTIMQHFSYTIVELVAGYVIGASIGLVLAAVITQFPFVEKVITPYILLLVTTPMLALVPLLILNFGPNGDDQRRNGLSPRRYNENLARPLLWGVNVPDLHEDTHPDGDADGHCRPDDRRDLRHDHCCRR